MVEPALDAPLSPELVLVSPDLKARALVEERIARPRPYLVPPPEEIVPLQPEAVSSHAEASSETPLVAAAPVLASPPPEWHLTVGAATLIALAAILVFGIGLAVGRFAIASQTSESAPTPVTPPTAAPAPAATQAAAPAVPSVTAPPVPPQPKHTSPPTAGDESTAHAVLPARLRRPIESTGGANSNPAAAGFRPVPAGGYVMPDGRGRFRVSSNGQTILDFVLATSCAGGLTLPPIEVGTTGTFAFAGHPGGSPSGTTARVKGRFVSSTEAHGTAQVSGPTCRLPATAFVARLS